MEVNFKLEDVLSHRWDEFCDEFGISLWAKAEGFGHTKVTSSIALAGYYCGVEVPDEVSEWKIDGNLIYRTKNGTNCDEIRVTTGQPCNQHDEELVNNIWAMLNEDQLWEKMNHE